MKVGRAAYAVVNEVRRQFKEIVGLKEGTATGIRQMRVYCYVRRFKANDTSFANRYFDAIISRRIFGEKALGGLLTSSIITILLTMMANSGGVG